MGEVVLRECVTNALPAKDCLGTLMSSGFWHVWDVLWEVLAVEQTTEEGVGGCGGASDGGGGGQGPGEGLLCGQWAGASTSTCAGGGQARWAWVLAHGPRCLDGMAGDNRQHKGLGEGAHLLKGAMACCLHPTVCYLLEKAPPSV